jgi:hypothetical protein
VTATDLFVDRIAMTVGIPTFSDRQNPATEPGLSLFATGFSKPNYVGPYSRVYG